MNNILDKRFEDFDLGNISIREYFYRLTSTLWEENECFNSKRPFGNSGWGYSLINFLIEEKLIKENSNNSEIDKFINNILKVLFKIENKSEREILKLSEIEIAAILNWDEVENNEEYFDENDEYIKGIWNDFEVIDEEDNYYSLEDCYVERGLIVKRISDNKLFKGSYTYMYNDTNIYDNLELIEVFPKEKVIIVYE